MLLHLLYLAIVGWLPGAALYRLPVMDRARRAGLAAEERGFWTIVLSLAVSLGIVLALAAMGRYTFERLLVADLAVALAAAAVSRGRLRLERAPRPTLWVILPLALVALGLWRFFPPSEYIIGGKDPGTYMNAGIQLAQRGGLSYDDPVVASVPPFARDLFFPSHERRDYYSVRFMGFWIRDPQTGAVVGQFPHLFPASIAVGYGIDGLTGARRTTGIWAILGLLAVYFAGARLVGRPAAAAAGALLALNVAQVWFARYPNAEVVMQALVFAALLASARAHVDGDRFFAPVAGVLLGLLLFLRIDALLPIVAVLGGVAAAWFNGVRPRVSMVLPLAAAGALAAFYYLGLMRAYAERPIIYVTHLQWWVYTGIALGGAIAAWAFAAARHTRVRAAVVEWLPTVISTALAAAAVYALFFRHPAGRLAAHDAYALRAYANFYVTVPAVLAAVAGFALYARRRFWAAPELFLTVAIFSFFFFFKIHIVPEHFWASRRFVPVILPATMLFAAGLALGDRARSMRARVIQWTLAAVFLGILGAYYARASRPVVNHVEYAGLIPRLEQLAGQIGPEDLVVAESRNAGGDIHVMALPLAYVYARNVLVLNSPRPDKLTFSAFVDWADARYDRVLFLGSGGTDILSYRYGVRPLVSDRFRVPEYESAMNAYPRGTREKEFDFGLYAFTRPEPRDDRWFDLDVGVRDDLHVVRFHAKESSAERSFRWTQRASTVTVTAVTSSSRGITLWMSNGGRPAAAPPSDVEVFFHGAALGTIRVGDGFVPYTVAIPGDLAARAAAHGDPVELRLVTTTWNPASVLGTGDDRELGVMLDRVTVR